MTARSNLKTGVPAFAQRVKQLAERYGSSAALARKSGLKPASIGKWLRGEADITRELLVTLADSAGVNIEWLAAGRGAMTSAASVLHESDQELATAEFAQELRVATANLAATDNPSLTRMIDLESLDVHVLPTVFVAGLGLSGPDLAILRVRGDAMEPNLREGDTAIIDISDTAKKRLDGVFALPVRETSYSLRRLQWLPDGRLQVSTDNPRYAPIFISKEEAPHISVMGRAVGALKRL